MDPRELLAVLRRANTLVADAAKWTARNFAEDPAGKWTPVGSERATRFNLAGALIKSGGPAAREAMQALEKLFAGASLDPTVLSSPGLTRTQALELLRWAMRRLEGDPTLPLEPIWERTKAAQ